MEQEIEKRTNRRVNRIAIIMLAAFISVSSFQLLYYNWSMKESQAIWCELVVSLDNRYQGLESTDPDALEFRDQIHRIRGGLPCPRSRPQVPSPS